MTQPATLQTSRTAAQLAAALELVDVVRIGDLMEARHRETGEILGTAGRNRYGWRIHVAPYGRELIIAPGVAELVLLFLAARAAGVR